MLTRLCLFLIAVFLFSSCNVVQNESVLIGASQDWPETTDSRSNTSSNNLSPDIVLFDPSNLVQFVSCGGGSLNFEIIANDAEGDSMTFTWLVNGVEEPPSITKTDSQLNSVAIFAPACSSSGAVTVTASVSDGRGSMTQSWNVVVSNPLLASIDTFSPTGNPIVLPSNGNQLFSIGASGKVPLTYTWKLDTVVVGNNASSYEVTSGSLTAGAHTLEILVNDADTNVGALFSV